MPSASRRSRISSTFSRPAAADEPSRLRPKRAPSSSAQSTSRSVTGGFEPCPYRRSASNATSTPRVPSSQPPFGTESRCPPMMTVLLDSPGSVTQLFPAASGTDARPSGDSFSCSHARAFLHTGPHATRCAPCGVDVSLASSRRSVMTWRALRRSGSPISSCMRAEDSTPRSMASTERSVILITSSLIGGHDMKSHRLFAITMASLGAAVVLLSQAPLGAQAPNGRRTGPGVQAAQDAREPEVLATCKTPPPPPRGAAGREGGGGGQGRGPAAGNPMAQEYSVTAIPGVIAAGQRWNVLWQGTGNNADGILGVDDGSVWLAQNDDSDILKVDKNGNATVIYKDTNTGGAVAINAKGIVYVAERGLNPAIFELAPKRSVFANSFQGDPLDCIGGTMHDLVVDSKGGVYFALGDPVFHADPKG